MSGYTRSPGTSVTVPTMTKSVFDITGTKPGPVLEEEPVVSSRDIFSPFYE